jgi:type IV secretory pathway TrbF-like protein
VTTELLTNGHRDELASLQAAYEALQRRDGSAERRAWQWQCVTYGVLILCGLLTLGLFWLIYQKTQIKAFVQVVQVNDDGKVVNLGVPQDLMTYEPQDEHWRDMLAHW